MNVGINENSRLSISNELSVLLADSYLLYMKTHGYHWNVTGPMFLNLHNLFMTQYEELWLALDEIAERIRALGHFAPYGYKQFKSLSTIQESNESLSALDMVTDLLEGQEILIATLRRILLPAQRAGDETTLGLISQRLAVHEKNAWMLRSLLSAH
ncbi:MAG: DNA starvation/stationary phase protection protein [Sulfuritalea sp.]|nr:DNA starvation/stationary phase protection protein [Sulfuritalea sp.]